MPTPAVRISIGNLASLAGLAVVVGFGTPAFGQDALGSGYNLQTDLNRGAGGGFRRSAATNNAYNNAIINGNATNGLSFQGQRGFSNPYEFQGHLGSNDLNSFQRNSYASQAANYGVSAAQIQNYQRSLLTGGGAPPGIGGNLALARNAYTGPSSSALGYKQAASGYRPASTTLSASGGLFGIDPFGRTRTGLTRDSGTGGDITGAGARPITPGGLGGERNLMRDLTSQLSSQLTRSTGNSGNAAAAGSTRPGSGNGSATSPGTQRGVPPAPGTQDPNNPLPATPFDPNGVQGGLNEALRTGKGYDKNILAQASNAEGWRQQQTASALTGIQVRTQAPNGYLPTQAPDSAAKTAAKDNITKMPGTNIPMERIDQPPEPRTAYDSLRNRITKYSDETKSARASGDDLLSYTLTNREAGGLTGLNDKDVIGMPSKDAPPLRMGPLSNPTGLDSKGQPEWEQRVQNLRQRLRQQAVVDEAKRYLSDAKDVGPKDEHGDTVKIPNLIQPGQGPSINLWGKNPNLLPDFKFNKDKKTDPRTAKPGETPKPKSAVPTMHLDMTTLKMIRESGGKVETLVNPGARLTDQYADFMADGQRLMAEGRYFNAEEAFARAMREPSADVTAQIARTHAQLGAGLTMSAASNLVKMLIEYPEMAGPKYGAALLPKESRQVAIMAQLRENIQKDDSLGRGSGILLAYLGYQRGEPATVTEGLDAVARIGRIQLEKAVPGINPDLLEDEGRLVEFLRGVWAAPQTAP